MNTPRPQSLQCNGNNFRPITLTDLTNFRLHGSDGKLACYIHTDGGVQIPIPCQLDNWVGEKVKLRVAQKVCCPYTTNVIAAPDSIVERQWMKEVYIQV